MKYLLPLLSLLVLLPISAIALGPHVSKVPNPHDNKIRWNRWQQGSDTSWRSNEITALL
jgi:hypothetical protein